MNVYALDSSNIDSFEHLADPISAEAVRSGVAHGFCVKTDDCHAGALIGRFTDTGEYEILSLYVLPEYRRQGVGELLLDTLAEAIGEYDANVSITFIARSEEDKELMSFLEDQGFEEYSDAESHLFGVTIGELMETKLNKGNLNVDYPTFADLSEQQLALLENASDDRFVPRPDGGFTSKKIETDVSIAVLKGDTPVAYAVVEKEDDNTLVLSSLYVHDEENTTLLRLLRCVMKRLNEKYSSDTVILIPTVNDDSQEILTSMFKEDAEINDILYTYRKFFPAGGMGEYKDMPLSDFLIDQQDELYGDDEAGAYLTGTGILS